MTEYEDIPKSEEATKTNLIKNIQVENGKTHTYTIEFRYQNSIEDQSDDMGKVFSGSLSITESNIVVIKYKVNNEDVIPNKEEPYVVDKVSCSNNAKGIWNEETETVELETPVKQTVCIVEFKEGYTVSMLTEHGEVVSPASNTVTYGAKYKLPGTNPTRVGYTFAGWFTAASGGTQVTTSINKWK